MFYLTEEDLLIAESNGISRELAMDRYYNKCWEKERAITQPKKCKGTFKEELVKLYPNYEEILKEIGISYGALYSRCHRLNIDISTALAYPKMKPFGKKKTRVGRITKGHIEQASKIGVSEYTLKYRVYNLRWSVEKAITTPLIRKGSKSK